MFERERGKFNPVSIQGRNPITQGGQVLYYSYAPVDFAEQGLREDVVVGRLPEYASQVVIGPSRTVAHLAQAFNILDSLYPDCKHRAMNVVVTRNFDAVEWCYCDWPDGRPVSQNLLDSFGISSGMSKSMYENYQVGVTSFGVYCDIEHPIFISPDYAQLANIYGEAFLPLYYASVIKHEQAHVDQYRGSLPVTSLWSERHAMTQQAVVLLRLLQSGKHKKETDLSLVHQLIVTSTRIENYRNGKGFSDHNLPGLQDSPMTEQVLDDDFQFGF